VFLEGYSFGSSGRGVLDLAEFGGILRVALAAWCPSNFREVAPSTLKQFATSKGNSKKEEVMAHVAHRYGHIFKSNDECDAWVLSRMAAVAAGWCRPDTTFQRTAVAVAKQLVPA
jgi:crossover junction endodeoxyribonuclease RuvC